MPETLSARYSRLRLDSLNPFLQSIGSQTQPARALADPSQVEATRWRYELDLAVELQLTLGQPVVYARYDTARRQKLRFDLLYTRNMSLWLDVRLILLSFWISLRGKVESRSRKF